MRATIEARLRVPSDSGPAGRGYDDQRDSSRPPGARVHIESLLMGAGAESFGAWLDQRMAERGLRKADLARATGVDASLIGRWLRGESLPGLPNLRRLAPALGIAWTDLAAQAGHIDGQVEATGRPVVQHPLVRDLARLLGEDSPLPDVERDLLERVIESVVSPYRSQLRRRRRTA